MALSPVSSDDDMEAAFNPLAPSRNDAFAEPGVAEAFAVADGASVPPSVASSASHGPLDLRDEPLDSAFNAEDPKPPPPPAKDVQSVPAAFMAPRAVEPPKPTGPCCATHAAILKWLQAYGAGNQDAEAEKREMVLIGDSQKTSDMTGSTFIVYHIITLSPGSNANVPLHTVLRRYSEFESLRKSLTRLHPTVVVPPIPEKHSLSDYASKASRTKDDPTVIAKRKRMLASFLNRIVRHPVLGADHIVHGFLEPGSWNEVLIKAAVPKSSNGGIVGKVLGKGSLISPDPHWINAESYTQQFHASISHAQRTSRSLLTSLDSSYHVLAELAAQYNAWSLSEPPLGQALERIGQALDATAKATTRLRTGLEASFVEPVQEQAQLADSVDKVLQWRHARNVEWESVLSEIEGKRSSLAGLERTEQEAVRVQQGLQQGNSTFSAPVQEAETAFPPPPTSFPPTAELGSSPPPRSSGILSTLNSLIDNDPAAARRATIARTREKIMTLSDRRENLQTELAQAGTAIQTDLDRYQREKMAELKGLVVAFAKEMREYSRRAAQAWEEAEKEVDKVEL